MFCLLHCSVDQFCTTPGGCPRPKGGGDWRGVQGGAGGLVGGGGIQVGPFEAVGGGGGAQAFWAPRVRARARVRARVTELVEPVLVL